MGVLVEVIGRKARGWLGRKVGLWMTPFFLVEGCEIDWIGEYYCWFRWIVPGL